MFLSSDPGFAVTAQQSVVTTPPSLIVIGSDDDDDDDVMVTCVVVLSPRILNFPFDAHAQVSGKAVRVPTWLSPVSESSDPFLLFHSLAPRSPPTKRRRHDSHSEDLASQT